MAADCSWSYADYSSASSDSTHTWVVTLQCGNGGVCGEYVPCEDEGQPGLLYDVYMDGADVGDVCVPDDPDAGPGRAQVVEAFRNLAWPASTLTVQPPGGETLVNLETIFFTTNSASTTRAVTLVRKSVTIEATPVSYSWSFGDDSSLTTASPGHAYPDHDVSHVYTTSDEFSASVATTYSGRYRIGDGDWQDIDETLTVPGPAVELEVVEAKPQLVLR